MDLLWCVIFCSANEDGAAGLASLKEACGFVVIYDPLTAEVSYMPEQALKGLKPNKLLKENELASYITPFNG